jgi:hypothetical protein
MMVLITLAKVGAEMVGDQRMNLVSVNWSLSEEGEGDQEWSGRGESW